MSELELSEKMRVRFDRVELDNFFSQFDPIALPVFEEDVAVATAQVSAPTTQRR